MFEHNALKKAGVLRGLILVDTDHGFALGHDPGKFDANRSVVVARAHDDAHDWVLWQNLGAPPVYRYVYEVHQNDSTPRLESLTFSEASSLRFEVEAEWPVLKLRDAWAIPGYPPAACVSKHRALIVHPSGRQPTIVIALPIPRTGRYRVGIGWISYESNPTSITATVGQITWRINAAGARFRCGSSWGPPIELPEGEQPLQLRLESSMLGLDWVELDPAT